MRFADRGCDAILDGIMSEMSGPIKAGANLNDSPFPAACDNMKGNAIRVAPARKR
jgi:hypothetical protein